MTMAAKTCMVCFRPEGNYECLDVLCKTGLKNVQMITESTLLNELSQIKTDLKLAIKIIDTLIKCDTNTERDEVIVKYEQRLSEINTQLNEMRK